jgi:glycosyltransferase involved in cell wall biosynthesis
MSDERHKPSVAAIVPCFNERDTIVACVRGLLAFREISCVAVADDGSSDGSPLLCAREARASGGRLKLFTLPCNMGKNAAVRHAARRVEADVVIVFDADLTVDAGEIPAVLALVEKEPGSFVYATRFRGPVAQSAMPRLRRWGNRILAAWVSRLTRRRMTDALCGLKALPRDVLLSRRMARCRWGDLDLIFAAAEAGLAFREIPVAYRARPAGTSKMNLLGAGASFAAQCLAYGLCAPSSRGKAAK